LFTWSKIWMKISYFDIKYKFKSNTYAILKKKYIFI
jgi:hypothetical protein